MLSRVIRFGPASILLSLAIGGFVAGFVVHHTMQAPDVAGAAASRSSRADDTDVQRTYFDANRAAIERDHSGQFVAVKGGNAYAADSWLDLWRSIESKPGGTFYAAAIDPAIFHGPSGQSTCSQ